MRRAELRFRSVSGIVTWSLTPEIDSDQNEEPRLLGDERRVGARLRVVQPSSPRKYNVAQATRTCCSRRQSLYDAQRLVGIPGGSERT